jgi:hypothetical protein
MGNGNKTLHKIRELSKVALNILRGIGGASWLLRHDTIALGKAWRRRILDEVGETSY